MLRFLTTVAMILFFAWCLLPVPSLRLVLSAMAKPDLSDHWTRGRGYEIEQGVMIVREPADTFDDRWLAMCDYKCQI